MFSSGQPSFRSGRYKRAKGRYQCMLQDGSILVLEGETTKHAQKLLQNCLEEPIQTKNVFFH